MTQGDTPRSAARSRKQEGALERGRPAANRSREQDQHANSEADYEIDFDASALKAPPPRPGYDQRWVRISVLGKDDLINVSRAGRKGWKARQSDTIKESFSMPTDQHGRFPGAFIVEGMLLCERPKSISKQHREHIRTNIDRQTAAIDQELRNTSATNRNPAFGPIEKQHRSVPVRERRVEAAEDDGDGGAGSESEVSVVDGAVEEFGEK